jgi:hypothetical protein
VVTICTTWSHITAPGNPLCDWYPQKRVFSDGSKQHSLAYVNRMLQSIKMAERPLSLTQDGYVPSRRLQHDSIWLSRARVAPVEHTPVQDSLKCRSNSPHEHKCLLCGRQAAQRTALHTSHFALVSLGTNARLSRSGTARRQAGYLHRLGAPAEQRRAAATARRPRTECVVSSSAPYSLYRLQTLSDSRSLHNAVDSSVDTLHLTSDCRQVLTPLSQRVVDLEGTSTHSSGYVSSHLTTHSSGYVSSHLTTHSSGYVSSHLNTLIRLCLQSPQHTHQAVSSHLNTLIRLSPVTSTHSSGYVSSHLNTLIRLSTVTSTHSSGYVSSHLNTLIRLCLQSPHYTYQAMSPVTSLHSSGYVSSHLTTLIRLCLQSPHYTRQAMSPVTSLHSSGYVSSHLNTLIRLCLQSPQHTHQAMSPVTSLHSSGYSLGWSIQTSRP